MDIDESYGTWPHDDEDLTWPLDADDDGDRDAHWENVREERRINGNHPNPRAGGETGPSQTRLP